MASADLPFPQCCAACPHRSSFTASCTHDFRQSVIQSLDGTRPCPVYVDEKTEAMRTLARSLDRAREH